MFHFPFYLLNQAKASFELCQGLVRRLLDRADGVSRKALREAVFYVVGPFQIISSVLVSDQSLLSWVSMREPIVSHLLPRCPT